MHIYAILERMYNHVYDSMAFGLYVFLHRKCIIIVLFLYSIQCCVPLYVYVYIWCQLNVYLATVTYAPLLTKHNMLMYTCSSSLNSCDWLWESCKGVRYIDARKQWQNIKSDRIMRESVRSAHARLRHFAIHAKHIFSHNFAFSLKACTHRTQPHPLLA